MAKQQSIPLQFVAGVRIFFSGLSFWRQHRRMMWLGVLPALITSLVFGALLVVLALVVGDLVTWATPFAETWDPGWALTLRVTVSVAMVGAAGVLMAFIYVSVVLLIGGPFYGRITARADAELGTAAGIPSPDETKSAGFLRSTLDSAKLLITSTLISLCLFLVGLIPAVGSVSAGVLGAFFGGWILAVELTTVSFEERGYTLAQRRKILGQSRAMTVGFGATVFVLLLVPLLAVVVIPVAVAASPRLAREAMLRTRPAKPAN